MSEADARRYQEWPLVLFVCRHGAAKSVLAATELERIAEAHGIEIKARAGGIEPDDQTAPAVLALLREGAPLGAERPRRVTEDDIQASSLTITFNLDESELPARPTRTLAWDDVPAVSERPRDAREVIDRHILELLELVTRGEPAG